MKDTVSNEFLNAFVDGELAADERAKALGLLEEDLGFKGQVCETRVLKELVRGAYGDLPGQAPSSPQSWCTPLWGRALAAGLLLCLGLGGGWLARGQLDQPPIIDRLAGFPDGYQPIAFSSQVDHDKIVLHLDSADQSRMEAALDLAERLVAERGERARVEVVVNSYGLNLLRQDTSPLKARIDRLADQYGNLAFVACGQTIARLHREGVEVRLIPEASVATSAIGEILERMRQGWVYVRV